MIITVTANPMLDKTLRISKLQRGQTHRASSSWGIAGGKGLNVSRQVQKLGLETLATGFLGGPIGNQLREILREEKLRDEFVEIAATTREGLTILEEDGVWTAVFEVPARATPTEADALVNKISSLAKEGDWLVLAGSVPNSELDTLYRTLITWAAAHGVFTLLDTYGNALKEALHSHPTLLKINNKEFEEYVGEKITTTDEGIAAIKKLSEFTEIAILTQGGGSFFASHAGNYYLGTPPKIQEVNAVGSGDSMSAGFLWKWSTSRNFEESLRWGAASGAANAAKWSVADSTETEIAAHVPNVKLEAV